MHLLLPMLVHLVSQWYHSIHFLPCHRGPWEGTYQGECQSSFWYQDQGFIFRFKMRFVSQFSTSKRSQVSRFSFWKEELVPKIWFASSLYTSFGLSSSTPLSSLTTSKECCFACTYCGLYAYSTDLHLNNILRCWNTCTADQCTYILQNKPQTMPR